ncbi:type I site-specific deoxyribonuclease [Scytonema sp. HK-05]|uniref:restriction endonuclease subunit S n=1 Tax=Scytonema sp. HK-05 TaxID=1137095 RepID=UPI0009361EEC|nr:restriction endonuclease subunit S [Scytonema sp. HK-05]OKH59030.1 hypothetical protein NIES2130_10750 [Scytonema sp. HK-05]BAY48800.1 type I site-specific deoxyribonuclease [Scytonema sp. HK-05]
MREVLVKAEEFKDSPLGKIPKDWKVYTLEECVRPDAQITYGIVQAGPHVEDGVPYIRTGDMAGDRLSIEGLLRTSPQIAASYRRSTVKTGEIVCAIRATVGKVLEVPPELDGANLTQGTARIAPCEGINSRFLLWALRSTYAQREFNLAVKGTTFSEITLENLRKINIALAASRNEQDKIAEILDTVDDAIARTSSLITKLKQIKAGLLHDLLTRGLDENGHLRDPQAHPEQFKDSPLGRIPKDWEVFKIESLLNGRPKNGYSPKEVNEWTGTLMLGLSCLTEEGFEPLQLKNAPRNDLKVHTTLLCDGDFLLSRSNTRERVALTGIYQNIGVPCIYPDLMMRLSINEKTSSRFLELLLRHSPVRRQLTGNAQGTSGSMVKISSQTVIETLVALPNSTEQARIIECINTYDTRIRKEEAYLNKLKLQKQGLMHDLLTGKVRVKNTKN